MTTLLLFLKNVNASYMGVKPRAQPSARIRLGGAF